MKLSFYRGHSVTYCIHYLPTYSMVQSPSWEANWFAASQEIPRILWNPKVHYRLTSVRHLSLSRASPIQSTHPHPTSWRSILILSTHLRLGLPSGLFPSCFPTKTLYAPLSSPIRVTCPAHLILLDFITRTILGEETAHIISLYWSCCVLTVYKLLYNCYCTTGWLLSKEKLHVSALLNRRQAMYKNLNEGKGSSENKRQM